MNVKERRIIAFSTICAQLIIYKLELHLLHRSMNKTMQGYMDNVDRLGKVVNFRTLNQVAKGQ